MEDCVFGMCHRQLYRGIKTSLSKQDEGVR